MNIQNLIDLSNSDSSESFFSKWKRKIVCGTERKNKNQYRHKVKGCNFLNFLLRNQISLQRRRGRKTAGII